MKYALVLVNIKGLGVKTFSYLIPDEMKNIIQIGQAVMVPFGRQGLINAFIVGFSDYLPGDFKAKKINRIIDETPLFSIKYLNLIFNDADSASSLVSASLSMLSISRDSIGF